MRHYDELRAQIAKLQQSISVSKRMLLNRDQVTVRNLTSSDLKLHITIQNQSPSQVNLPHRAKLHQQIKFTNKSSLQQPFYQHYASQQPPSYKQRIKKYDIYLKQNKKEDNYQTIDNSYNRNQIQDKKQGNQQKQDKNYNSYQRIDRNNQLNKINNKFEYKNNSTDKHKSSYEESHQRLAESQYTPSHYLGGEIREGVNRAVKINQRKDRPFQNGEYKLHFDYNRKSKQESEKQTAFKQKESKNISVFKNKDEKNQIRIDQFQDEVKEKNKEQILNQRVEQLKYVRRAEVKKQLITKLYEKEQININKLQKQKIVVNVNEIKKQKLKQKQQINESKMLQNKKQATAQTPNESKLVRAGRTPFQLVPTPTKQSKVVQRQSSPFMKHRQMMRHADDVFMQHKRKQLLELSKEVSKTTSSKRMKQSMRSPKRKQNSASDKSTRKKKIFVERRGSKDIYMDSLNKIRESKYKIETSKKTSPLKYSWEKSPVMSERARSISLRLHTEERRVPCQHYLKYSRDVQWNRYSKLVDQIAPTLTTQSREQLFQYLRKYQPSQTMWVQRICMHSHIL